jgi:tRNA U34 5-carboxymethylaminomethyl modifying enzyme MnmG/GidA
VWWDSAALPHSAPPRLDNQSIDWMSLEEDADDDDVVG